MIMFIRVVSADGDGNGNDDGDGDGNGDGDGDGDFSRKWFFPKGRQWVRC